MAASTCDSILGTTELRWRTEAEIGPQMMCRHVRTLFSIQEQLLCPSCSHPNVSHPSPQFFNSINQHIGHSHHPEGFGVFRLIHLCLCRALHGEFYVWKLVPCTQERCPGSAYLSSCPFLVAQLREYSSGRGPLGPWGGNWVK